MKTADLSKETFSYRDFHRFNDNTFILVVRDEEFPNSNLLSILYYNNGKILDINRYEMGDKILATKNLHIDMPPLSERLSLQQLAKISIGNIINNDKYHEGSPFPNCITFHTNIQPFGENEIVEIFEGVVNEENAVLVLKEFVLNPLIKDYYIGTNNAFFILTNNIIKGPYKVKQIDVSGNLIIEKSFWKTFGEYLFDSDSHIEFKANDITRRIVFPSVNELKLIEKKDFITNAELMIKLENQIVKNPDLYIPENLKKLLEFTKKVSAINLGENEIIQERILHILRSTEQEIKFNLSVSEILPEINNIKNEIDLLERKKLNLNNELLAIEQAKTNREQDLNQKEDEIKTLENNIQNLKIQIQDIGKYKEEELKKSKIELEDIIAELEHKRASIDNDVEAEKELKFAEIKTLEGTIKYLEGKEESLKVGLKTLQDEFTNEQQNAHKKLKELLIENQHYNILTGREFTNHANSKKKSFKDFEYQYVNSDFDRLKRYESIREKIIDILAKNNRKFDSHFIDNILISIHQNTITLFAGLPGTGKTSLVKLLMNALTPSERIREVAVGRGWSSQKDLIGFYNPLSGKYHASSTDLYSLIEQLNWEYKENKYINAPLAFVLLDEANLSPLEHYWSIFYNLTDNHANSTKGLKINIGGDEFIEYPNNLRFIGTINYDQTTEELSPRVVDRANIIKMDTYRSLDINKINVSDIRNIDISFKECIDIFELIDFKEEHPVILDEDFDIKFNEIKKKFEDLKICISPRVQIAIKRYCKVAKTVMYEQNKPLDYSIAQRLLPLIRVQGNNAKQKLKELKDILDENKYDISSKILNEIIQKGEDGEIFQDNFNYFLTLSHV